MIQNIKGLKFPDSYFIKFFFKNNLHKKHFTYLEFGCGNGNNLMLPAFYGNKVIGVDINKKNINNANENFENLSLNNYSFYTDDMVNFVKTHKIMADVISLPNVINYICKKDFLEFLDNLEYNKNAYFFIRYRNPKDFRNGFGEYLNNNCYKVTSDITSEKNAINCFYELDEMLDILKSKLNLYNYFHFEILFENLANDKKILNADTVIWGRIK